MAQRGFGKKRYKIVLESKKELRYQDSNLDRQNQNL